jgi:serine protease Do
MQPPALAGAKERAMSSDFSSSADRPASSPPLAPADLPPPPPVVRSHIHPLDRTEDDPRIAAAEATRIRLAWAKLVWLLSFLAVLLAISYLIPFIAEQTQYAITRGKQRAEHEYAKQHIGESPIGDLSRAYQMVSQVVGPSVVHISTQGNEAPALPLTSFKLRPRGPMEGQGSGIIVEASGYILTNQHVINDAQQIQVSLADGRKLKAKLIGHDKATDLAVLKITADRLVPATWGDSEAVEPGALVWAIGSPFGLERTITSGILSAKHRAGLAGKPHQDFLQSDAAVNPGNSGGPLVDVKGQVIGINTAIVGEAYQGISFAIPSKVAREIYERLKAERVVRRGWLGVQLADVTPEQAEAAGLAQPSGVYISGIAELGEGSPAARAGIQPGDIVLRWNDTAVNARADFSVLVGNTPIGSRAKVTVLRSGNELSLEVVVGERPPEI